MNKKLLSIILIIGLIGTINAGAIGDPVTCSPAQTGVQKCAATDTSGTVGTGAANCAAGYSFTAGSTLANGSCTICPINTYQAAQTDTDAAKTTSDSCTACATGATTMDTTGNDAFSDCSCDSKSALSTKTTATGACVTVPAAQLITGGRSYTTSDETTFTLASCDNTMGYKATPASGACTPCTATGCAACEADATKCDSCRDGFRDTDSGATTTCAACAITNCATCDSTGTSGAEKCQTAKDGFYVDASNAVQACPANATKCKWDTSLSTPAVTVTAVAAGFYVKTGATNVATACPVGKSSLANSDAAQADGGATSCTITCASNCVNCNTAGTGKCDVCKDDFYVDSAATDATKVCVAFTDATRPITCQTAIANDASSCTSCATDTTFRVKDPAALSTDTKWACVCPDTYTDQSNVAAPATKTGVCKKCGNGVKKCDAGQPIVCTTATDQAAGQDCFAPSAAQGTVTGFFYDTATSSFKACESTCEKCAGSAANQCVSCAKLNVDTTQLTSEDVTTLASAWINGTYTAAAPGTCYAKCPEGYNTDPATRVTCEMSFANILSVVVLISSIVLMF